MFRYFNLRVVIAFGVGGQNKCMHDGARTQPVWIPCKAIKQAKRQYGDKVESQFNSSDKRRIYRKSRTTKGKPAASQTPTSFVRTS